MRVSNPISFVVVVLAMMVQFMVPLASASTQSDLRPYLCNQSGAQVSEAAKAHITELLSLAGKDVDDTSGGFDHCPDCIVFMQVLAQPQYSTAVSTRYAEQAIRADVCTLISLRSARGPPLGGRAPPFFQ